jgi:hypothetical protein
VYDPGNNLVFSSASVQVTNSGKVGVASGYAITIRSSVAFALEWA